jgi:hypothetical protein
LAVKKLPKAPIAGHRNERRHAEAMVARVKHSLPLASSTSDSVSYSCRTGLLLEVPCGTSSKLALGFKPYGYALRVVKPRRSCKARKNKPAPVCTKAPPKPPVLRKGRIAVWRLDLRSHKHVTALLKHLKTMELPRDISFLHTHGAPPCTWVAPGSPLNYSMGKYSTEVAKQGALMLHVTRKIQEAMHARRRPRSSTMKAKKHTFRVTGSHEQTAKSSTATGLKVLGKKEKYGIKDGFPWGVGEHADKTTISGAALGAFDDGEPTTKRWTVESDNNFVLQCLAEFHKSPYAKLKPIWSSRGKQGAGSKKMENYPKFMGAYMAAAIACD